MGCIVLTRSFIREKSLGVEVKERRWCLDF